MNVDYPYRFDARSRTAETDTSDHIRDMIEQVLFTAPGERVMRPQFGCRIWDLLFEPVTPGLLGLIAQAVDEALAQWEPRVEVTEVDPQPDERDGSLVHIVVHYVVKTTNDRRNLVYPFYVIPHEPD